jgi:hypothetical protein
MPAHERGDYPLISLEVAQIGGWWLALRSVAAGRARIGVVRRVVTLRDYKEDPCPRSHHG